MGIIVTHTAECDFCGKSTIMSPINMHVPDAGYALPLGWFRDAYNRDVIMCSDCTREQYLSDPDRVLKVVKTEPVKSEWQDTTAFECKHCQNLFRDDLKQCPWCGADMRNGTMNYR